MTVPQDLIERLSHDMDRSFMSAFSGAITNTTAAPEQPPVTAESILASIKSVMASMPPVPPQIVQTRHLVDRHEDWSRVRSHGRASRRRKQGKRQNIVVTETPQKEAFQIDGKVFVHPDTWAEALQSSESTND